MTSGKLGRVLPDAVSRRVLRPLPRGPRFGRAGALRRHGVRGAAGLSSRLHESRLVSLRRGERRRARNLDAMDPGGTGHARHFRRA